MHRLRLPEPLNDTTPAFTDPATAQAWLARLAPKPATDTLAAMLEQIEALDGGPLSPPQTIALLNLLRSAAVLRQAIAEGQFTRKALPMLADEERSFAVAQQLWTRMGIAYLRLVPQCTPANRCLPLHRAASAFRMAQYCHFLAARTCTPLLDQLLLSVLFSAEANGVLRRPPAAGRSGLSAIRQRNCLGRVVLGFSDPHDRPLSPDAPSVSGRQPGLQPLA